MGYRFDLTGQRFGRWEVIKFAGNKNGQSFWECKCDCGTYRNVNSGRLKNGSSKSCGCLSRELTSKRSQKDITNQQFGRLIALYPTEKRNKGGKVIWHCQCQCGNYIDLPIDALTSNQTKSCGCLSREKASERFLSDITGQVYGHLTAVKRDNTKPAGRVYWLCKCDCGNPNLESIHGVRLRNGDKTQCSLCMPRSRGEEKIRDLLLKNNSPFVQEKSFEDCKFESGHKARFDFYVNNQYIIEFDGRQHIEETTKWGNRSLEYVQAHDKVKNIYCKEHNIPLIRIPYTKLNYLKIEDLLLESSKYIL